MPLAEPKNTKERQNGGPRTKPAGHVPQPCPQEQDAAHDLPGQRREAAGRRHLVRQFLRAAAARRAFAARLQARHLDHHAGAPVQLFEPERRSGDGRGSRSDRQLRRAATAPRAGREPARRSGRSSSCRSCAAEGRQPARRATREARLEEAVGLAEAIDLDVVEALAVPLADYRAGDAARHGQGRGDRARASRTSRSTSSSSTTR